MYRTYERQTSESPQQTQDNSYRSYFLIIGTQLIALVLLIGVGLNFVTSRPQLAQNVNAKRSILGVETSHLLPKTDVITILTNPTPTPILASIVGSQTRTAVKPEYTIAVIGDSMIDTMGEYADYLEHRLKRVYPGTIFHLYNYGRGSQTVSEALAKVNDAFHYQTRNYPPLPSIKPDIIISGSFAYNPYTPYDRNHHWIELTHMIEKLRVITPNVYLLAEIAPLRKDFGTGHQGVNWESSTNYIHSGHIIEQLQNAEGLSRTLEIPLIDVFADTYNEVTKEGNAAYIDPADHIHPSVYGHEKMAEKIVEVLDLN